MAPRAQPGSRRTSPLPHPAPWRSRSAARPRHLGAGPMGGAYANMFTLKFGLASPLEEKCTAPAPGVEAGEGGCGSSRRRVSSFCAPLLGTFTAFPLQTHAWRVSPRGFWARALRVHRPVEVTLCEFPSFTLHEGMRSLGSQGVESANAGPWIDKTFWERCMRALHVRRSGRARSTT